MTNLNSPPDNHDQTDIRIIIGPHRHLRPRWPIWMWEPIDMLEVSSDEDDPQFFFGTPRKRLQTMSVTQDSFLVQPEPGPLDLSAEYQMEKLPKSQGRGLRVFPRKAKADDDLLTEWIAPRKELDLGSALLILALAS